MTKPTKWPVHPAKTQISLGIRQVWSESTLCAQWVAKDLSFLHVDNEDADQIGRMPMLIWVFARRIVDFVGFVMLRLIGYDRSNCILRQLCSTGTSPYKRNPQKVNRNGQGVPRA